MVFAAIYYKLSAKSLEMATETGAHVRNCEQLIWLEIIVEHKINLRPSRNFA